MKIFENKISSISSTKEVSDSSLDKAGRSTKSKGPARKKAMKVDRPNLSSDEIRQKLASNVEMSNTAKKIQKEKNSQKLGEGFLNGDAPVKPQMTVEKPNSLNVDSENDLKNDPSVPNFKDHLVKSDVGINDPADTTTTEKLKTVLSKGAFNFNSKEREALDKILNS